MKPAILLASLSLLLGGCVSYSVKDDGVTRARIGQTANFGTVAITPLEVLEDSRCPAGVQCVWAGRVRVKARIDTRGSSTEQEIVLGEAVPAGTGTLHFIDVRPAIESGRTIWTEDYRFGFDFNATPAK